ncbi:MAG: PEP-CTERM sorting domain-containing protein, partial [Gemmatimonadales bacterium]
GIGECSSKMGAWDGGDVNTPGDELNEECYPVPEPGTNALLAIGMVGLAFVAVRRRSLSELLG